MKKFKGIDFQSLMGRLSNIPGLHFLKTWVTEYKMTRTRVRQRVGDLKGYADLAKEGAGAVRSGGAAGDDDEERRDEYDDAGDRYSDDDYVDDYADDYYTDDDYEY